MPPRQFRSTDLQAVFLDRLNQALNEHTATFPPGRGRVVAFARCFDIHYTTAQRILEKGVLPGTRTLIEIAHALGVTCDWLLGASAGYAPRPNTVEVMRYAPLEAGHMASHFTLPTDDPAFAGNEGRQLVFASATGRFHRQRKVIAVLDGSCADEQVCLIYFPGSCRMELRRVQMAGPNVFLHTGDGRDSERFVATDLDFGLTHTGGNPCVVGPVLKVLAEPDL